MGSVMKKGMRADDGDEGDDEDEGGNGDGYGEIFLLIINSEERCEAGLFDLEKDEDTRVLNILKPRCNTLTNSRISARWNFVISPHSHLMPLHRLKIQKHVLTSPQIETKAAEFSRKRWKTPIWSRKISFM